MNTGLDVIIGSSQAMHIGVVKHIARIEEAPVKDKLGETLRSFEIIFNVGDIITGARAAPLEICKEVRVGDHVLIYSMENIYSNTFFYQAIRNLNSPKDSIKLNYNNAGLEIKPTSSGNADILLNAGNNLITVDSENGTISLDSLNGVKINGGTNPIDISNDSQKLHELVNTLLDEITKMKIICPQGIGTVSPDSITKFLNLDLKFRDLLGDVDNSEYYPVVPDNELSRENVEDLVRDLGLDILADEEIYISGTNSEIDNVRESFEGELGDDAVPTTPTDVATGSNNSVANDPTCPVGVKNSTKLSTNFTVASLTTGTAFPHSLRDLSSSCTSSNGKRTTISLTKDEIACNLKGLATNILEPLKAHYPNMRITSCFRTSNTVTSGISQHCKGEAVDVQFTGVSPSGYVPIAAWVANNLPYDQLIFEHSRKGTIWLHISYARGREGRRSQLTMLNGKYKPGLTLHYS